MILAEGYNSGTVDPKVVQRVLGHATASMTMDAQTSDGTEVCMQYYTVQFTSNLDGSVTGTIAGNPIWVD